MNTMLSKVNSSLSITNCPSPAKPRITHIEVSTNDYDINSDQCDTLYLNNMTLSKIKNSNLEQSGKFDASNIDVSICSFRISNHDDSNNEEKEEINDSYITLKDLNVTPCETREDITSTPISTMCNYYLHSESNTKSVRKKKEFSNIKSTFEKSSNSKTSKNVGKFLTLNKKIDFNNSNNGSTVSNKNMNNTAPVKKNQEKVTVKKVIQLELYESKNKKETRNNGSKAKSNSVKVRTKPKSSSVKGTTRNKNSSTSKGTIAKQNAIENIKKIYHSLNKKAESLTKKKNNIKPIKDIIKSIKHKSLSKESSKKKSSSVKSTQSKTQSKSKQKTAQNKKTVYNNIHNIKVQVYHNNTTTNNTYTPITTTINLSSSSTKKKPSKEKKSTSKSKTKTSSNNKITVLTNPCYSTMKKQTSFISKYNKTVKTRSNLTILTAKQKQNLTNISKRNPSPSSMTNQSTRTFTMTSQSSRPNHTESSEKRRNINYKSKKGQIVSIKKTNSAIRKNNRNTSKR